MKSTGFYKRKYLLNKWAWTGGAIAFAFLLPCILWNAANGWPTLEFWSTHTDHMAECQTLRLDASKQLHRARMLRSFSLGTGRDLFPLWQYITNHAKSIRAI